MAKLSSKMRRDLSNKSPKLTVLLEDMFKKPVPSEPLRQLIAQDIIDAILERTSNSQFLKAKGNGKESAYRYSGAYISSIEFRVFGKSSTQVNLRASGDMLRDIDLIDSDETKLQIGFEETEEGNKAHGHITGSVGKMRDFFGLPEGDVKTITDRYQAQVNALNQAAFVGEERAQGESNLEFLLRFFGAQNGAS